MDVRELVSVVQHYLNVRKDIQIDINMAQFNNTINLIKLNNAYNIAVNWFQSNGLVIDFNN